MNTYKCALLFIIVIIICILLYHIGNVGNKLFVFVFVFVSMEQIWDYLDKLFKKPCLIIEENPAAVGGGGDLPVDISVGVDLRKRNAVANYS
jgi:hypothetical protein